MRSSELAEQVTEGANLLGVFLCTDALRTLRAKGTPAEVNGLLVEALAKYGPSFRAMKRLVRGSKEVEPALQRLIALVRLGLDLDQPQHLTDLRAAVRELLSNVGFVLPHHAPGKGVVCEIHGRACPVEGGTARR